MNLKVGLLTMLLVGSFSMSTSATENETNRLRELVDSATTRATNARCRNAGMVMDNLLVLRKTPEFLALQESLVNSWQVALSNLDAIAENDMAKTIALCSCWSLSEDDFVGFLRSAAILVEEGKLNRNIYRWCQSPMESPLAGFLSRNYMDPDVQDVIIRSRKIFQDQPERVKHYDMMLTGENRKKLGLFEAAMRENQVPGSNQVQEANIQEAVVRDSSQVGADAETEEISTPADRQAEENPVGVVPEETDQQGEQKRGVVLSVVVGFIAVLAGAGAWIFRSFGRQNQNAP